MPVPRILRLLSGVGAALAALPALAQTPPLPTVDAQVHVVDPTGRVCVSGFGQSGPANAVAAVQTCDINVFQGAQVGGSNLAIGIQTGSDRNSAHVIQITPPTGP